MSFMSVSFEARRRELAERRARMADAAPTGVVASAAQSTFDQDVEADPNATLAGLIESEIKRGAVELPVLPAAAAQVRRIVSDGGGPRDLAQVLGHDPVLAAAILRHANSAAYAGLREVTDLQQAVTRLGISSVDRTVLALSAKNAFAPSDQLDKELYALLWTHSMTAAAAARKLAPRSASFSPETVFLAALLHDMGKIVVLRCAAMLRKRDPHRFRFERVTLLEFFEALHCKTGDTLCESWHLPPEVRDVMRRHHDASLTGPNDALVAIVQLSNRIAAKLGASLKPDQEISLLDLPGAQLLRLDDVKLASLLVEIEDEVSSLRETFL